jgi:phosphopantothenoylcysteine decarboxylase/phosphopantothenate--cysteine ligase
MKVALGVTGCIAAYKAVEVLRGLQKAGADVQVVMTEHATEFVGRLTFQAISGHQVIARMFEPTEDPEIKHIGIAQSIDLLLVAPATANLLAKFANGIADDFLSTLYISTRAPVMIAPAMNVEMWAHPATQENVKRLVERGVYFVDPEDGYLACRTVGPGRLADPETIVGAALRILTAGVAPSSEASGTGENFLITAGPTFEAIDPVRGLTNRSSGKMGFALAEAALETGADVTLVTGPVSISPPSGASTVRVRSADEMYKAVMERLDEATVVVMAAAVSDYRPLRAAQQKIKKTDGSITLELESTHDILAAAGKRKNGKLLVGFAAETEAVIENARQKLIAKNADMIVANDVTASDSGFDVDTNRVILITRDEELELPLMSKKDVARTIVARVLAMKKQMCHAAV